MGWITINNKRELYEFYQLIIPGIRSAARKCGFGIGIHGSMTRDLDVIAIPWIEEHSGIDELANAIQEAACGMQTTNITWNNKPAGRKATSIPICWTDFKSATTGYIDLSVMIQEKINESKS